MRFTWVVPIALLLAPLAVYAGPNAGGVLVVHSTSLAYTSDVGTYIGQSSVACGQDGPVFIQTCPPYDPLGGADPCVVTASNPTSAQPADAAQIWFVLAAFPEISCPRLKALGFGFQYNERWAGDPNGKVSIFAYGYTDPYDPDLVFAITSNSWFDDRPFPATGSSVALSFTQTRTSHLQELMWFAGYAYSDGAGDATFALMGHPIAGNRFFIDDSMPPVGDPIDGYGTLGFNGTTGSNPSPVQAYACCVEMVCIVLTPAQCALQSGQPTGDYYCDPDIPDDVECLVSSTIACCLAGGICEVLTPVQCAAAGGVDLGPATPCDPNPCVAPQACCLPDGTCLLVPPGDCSGLGGEFAGGPCAPNPCLHAPDVTVSPELLDFGPVLIGEPKTLILTVANIGDAPLTVLGLSAVPVEFYVEGAGFLLAPGESRVVPVTFTPQAEGLVTGSLAVTSDDPDEPEVNVTLQGEGVLPGDIDVMPLALEADLLSGEQTTRDFYIFNEGEGDIDWSIVIGPSADAIPGGSAAGPEALSRAPAVPAARAARRQVGAEPWPGRLLDLTGLRILWDRSHGQVDWSYHSSILSDLTARGAEVVENGEPITTGTLAEVDLVWTTVMGWDLSAEERQTLVTWVSAGGSLVLEGAIGSTTGYYQALLDELGVPVQLAEGGGDGVTNLIHEHAITEGVEDVYLSAAESHIETDAPTIQPLIDDTAGWLNLACTFAGSGRLLISASVLGSNFVVDYADNRLLLNQAVDWIAVPGWLRAAPLAGHLEGHAPDDDVLRHVVRVTFDATHLFGGDYEGTIWIFSNDPDEPQVGVAALLHVTGVPDIAAAPDSLEFGSVYIGDSRMDSVIVTNAGTDLLTVSSVSATPVEFTVEGDGFSLAPGESRVLEVTFAPESEGPVGGALTVASDDPDEPELLVPLRGEGVRPPDIGVAPDSLAADLFLGGSETQTLSISNAGGADLTVEITIDFLRAPAVPGRRAPGRSSAGDPGGVARVGTSEEKLSRSETPPALEKGEPDPRIYPRMDRGAGGPDAYGYTWIDVDQPGGPAFDWIDASDGTSLYLSDDTFVYGVPLGFTFTYYGMEFTEIGVGSNGWLSLVDGSGWFPPTVPSVDGIAGAIAPFARDLYPPSATYIRYRTVGSAPSRKFVIEYNGIPNYGGGFAKTFEVVLFEGTNRVRFQYLDADDAPSGFGIESPDELAGMGNGGAGDLFISPAVVRDGYVIEFWPEGAIWLEVDPVSAVIPPGGTQDVNVTFDAAGLFGGDYEAVLHLQSNDPDEPLVDVAAHLHVTGVQDIAWEPAALDFGEVYLTASKPDTVRIENAGTDVLTVFGLAAEPADFAVSPDGFVLAPGESQEVEVMFAPQSAGPIAGTLTVTSDDPDEPSVEVPLSGVGVPPPDIAVTPDSLSADLLTGQTDTQTVWVANEGESDLVWTLTVTTSRAGRFGLYPLTAPRSDVEPPAGEGSGERSEPMRTEPLVAELRDLTGVEILWDRSRGQEGPWNWTVLVADLVSRGALVTENFASLTPELLAGIDLLWSEETYLGWEVAELEAVRDWVAGGGSLLLEGDSYPATFNALLTALGAGVSYSGSGGSYGTTTSIYPHETTTDVSSIYLDNPVGSLSVVGSPGVPLVDDVAGDGAAACAQVGLGRLVTIADEILGDWAIGVADNQLFGNQVVDWLAGPSWLLVEPTSGVVAPGLTEEIAVTFDAAGLFGGDYEAVLHLLSNDPDEPLVDVAAHLHVTGVQDIAWEPAALDFGEVYLTASKPDTVRIENAGTDALTVFGLAAEPADFAVSPDGFVLDPGESREVEVMFAPQSAGPIAGALTVTSDDPDEPSVEVPLSGVGVPPPDIAVTPDSLSADLFTGGTTTTSLTIENGGLSELSYEIRIQPREESARDRSLIRRVLEANAQMPLHAEEGSDAASALSDPPSEPRLSAEEILAQRGRFASPRQDWIYAVVLDGFGTYYPSYTIWDDLNANWGLYGSDEILIDYSTFHAVEITSTGLEAVRPDMIIVSDNWNPGAAYGAFTESECQAIAQYVEAGAGLYISGGTFNNGEFAELQFQVTYLAPLVGLNGAESYFWNFNPTAPLDLLQPDHPLLRDVPNPWVSGFTSTTVVPSSGTWTPAALPEAELLAQSPNATCVLVARDNRVYHSALPEFHTGTTGDRQFVYNMIVTTGNSVTWLSVDPDAGTIPPDASLEAVVTFDASGLVGGDYEAWIEVASNDPDEPLVDVAAHLHVTGVQDIAWEPASLDFGEVYLTASEPDTVRIENAGTDALTVFGLAAEPADFAAPPDGFVLAPGESREVEVMFAPQSAGAIAGTLTVTSDDPDEPSVEVPLSGVGVPPPDIAVTPDSLSADLLTGQVDIQTVSVANTGDGELHFQLSIAFAGAGKGKGGSSGPSGSSSNPPRSTGASVPGTGWGARAEEPQSSSDQPPPGYQAAPSTPARHERAEVLLVQDVLPWGSDANAEVLSGQGIAYDVIPSAMLSATELSSYKLVIVPSDQPTSFYSTLAAQALQVEGFVAAGGVLEFHAAGWGWSGGDASLVTVPGGMEIIYYPSDWNDVLDPLHPLVVGVPDPFDGTRASHCYFFGVPESATLVAADDQGRPNLVVYPFGNGQVVAGCQTFEYGYSGGQAAGIILANMIPYAYGLRPVWLTAEPLEGVVPSGGSLEISVRFDASGLFGGDYEAVLHLQSNDPDEPVVEVAAHLHVTGVQDIVWEPASLDFGEVYLTASKPDTVRIENAGTDALTVFGLAAEPADFAVSPDGFVLAPGESREVEVMFAPQSVGPIAGTLTVTSDDPDEPSVEVPLSGVGVPPPDIAVTPDSLSAEVAAGESGTATLSIANTGGDDLLYRLSFAEGSAWGGKRAGFGTGVGGFASEGAEPAAIRPKRISFTPDRSSPQVPGAPGSPAPTTDAMYEGAHVRFGVTDFGEVFPFQYPLGSEHLAYGTYLSGFAVAYFAGGMERYALADFDVRDAIFPVSYAELQNDSAGVAVEVVVQTIDGVLEVERHIEFQREGKGVRVRTRVRNLTGDLVGAVDYKELTDWDVNGIYDQYWDYDMSRNLVYGWQTVFAGTASETSPAWMDIDGWNDLGQRGTTVDYPSGPVFTDGLAVLHHQLGDLAPSGEAEAAVALAAGSDLADLQASVDALLGTWLTTDPASGVVPPGEAAEVLVTFDATELDPGEYQGTLRVLSNDPDEPEVGVPVVLVVTGGAADPPPGAGEVAESIPATWLLDRARPNPFARETALTFGLPRAASVRLVVYGLAGQEVLVLRNGPLAPGVHHVCWNGRDAGGKEVPSGLYFCRLEGGGRVLSQRVLRIR